MTANKSELRERPDKDITLVVTTYPSASSVEIATRIMMLSKVKDARVVSVAPKPTEPVEPDQELDLKTPYTKITRVKAKSATVEKFVPKLDFDSEPEPPHSTAEDDELDKILNPVRWGDHQREDGSWAHGIVNQAELKTALLAWSSRRTAKAALEAYDEALFDCGYEKRQVGPVTREIVDGKRDKYRIVLAQLEQPKSNDQENGNDR